LRGGSIITTVSFAGDVIELNRSAASAAMKRVRVAGRLFKRAFCVAEEIDEGDISMPRLEVKREERVIVKRPEPE
jgi:hypothetical protein